ncbi:MAG: alpha/beta fold hydrolase [Acidimicrobiales bacterium]
MGICRREFKRVRSSGEDHMLSEVRKWEALGSYYELCGHRIFAIDLGPSGIEEREPLVFLHGFPTSSYDFYALVDRVRRDRRVVLFDLLGYGLSEKPDIRYSIGLQADIVVALTGTLGIERLSMFTHDMGDTVGGELLAREMEGAWSVEIVERLLTNGSIYIEMAHLSAGQEMLLEMADEKFEDLGVITRESLMESLRATHAPSSTVRDSELAAQCEMIMVNDGHLLLARLIRYIEERRQNQGRYTGAIESHPAPLSVIWGAKDPIAVSEMAARLLLARPDAQLRMIESAGHFPMIERPDEFLIAMSELGW